MYDDAEEVVTTTSDPSESVNELLEQLEDLFIDPELSKKDTPPVKLERRDDPSQLLDDLQTLYLSSGPVNTNFSNPQIEQTRCTERFLIPHMQRNGPDVEDDELWSASYLNKSRQKKKKRIQGMSSSTAWSTAYDYNQPSNNECLNSIPTIGGNGPERPNMREQPNSIGQGFGPPQRISPNNLDLASLYFNTPQQQQPQQQYTQNNYFADHQGGTRGRNQNIPPPGFNRVQYNNGVGWSNQGHEVPMQQHMYSRGGPQIYSTVEQPEGKLNPYANEFSPIFNAPQNNNHYTGNGPTYTPQYLNHHNSQHQYKEQYDNRRSYPVQIEEVTSEIPEGASTVNMPHIYLGKFMMNRAEFETKHGVTITTKSQDGGYLIIVCGDKAAEAAAEMEKMWSEEPIRSSDDITDGKVVIKVAPDRYEGVVCFPMEHYAKLLGKRNDVESKHKVRILVKFLPDHSRYRATIRASKKETAQQAADDLENLIMTPDTPS